MSNPGDILTVGAISILALVSIYPLTAATFLNARLPRKTEEYKRMREKLGYTEQSGPAYVPSLNAEYNASDYKLPVAFVSLIAGLCAFTMVLGPHVMTYEPWSPGAAVETSQPGAQKQARPEAGAQPQTPGQPAAPQAGKGGAENKAGPESVAKLKNSGQQGATAETGNGGTQNKAKPEVYLLLNGPSLAKDTRFSPNDRDVLFAMLIVSLAFAGSYTWSIQYLYRRLATLDLAPGAYYSIGIRIILSVFVALLVYYSFSSGDVATYGHGYLNSPSAIAIYGFLAGMFPQRWLKWIQDKFNLANKSSTKASSPLPLAMIEGIGLFERTRFIEMGIDNAQNLAKSNFVEIIIRSPFNPREVIDWIGQARLYLYFHDEIQDLRERAGIRTIFNLKKAGDKGVLETVAELSGISTEKLTTVYTLIRDDEDIQVLVDATEKLIIGEKAQHHDKTIAELREKAGIRSIFNLKKAGDENALEAIAQLSGIPIETLTTVYTFIRDDKDIQVLLDATDRLIAGEKGSPQVKTTAEPPVAEAAAGDQKA